MRAKVLLENFNWEECGKVIREKLAEVRDLQEITVNTEECSVSFIYKNDDAALSVVEKLNLLGQHSL